MLRVVAQSLKPLKLLSQQLPTFLLFRDRRSVAQQSRSQRCWGLRHPFARSLIVLTVINDHEQVLFVLLFSFQVYDVVSSVPPVSFDLRLKR